jgi:uncharacterized protein (DUF305 family)
MGLRVRLIAFALLWRTATASGQSSSPAPESAPIVQPGAPGQSSKRITAAEAQPPLRAPSAADVSFMQGMIMHHAQAVKMTDLLRVRTHSKELLELGKRISISQADEMKYMQQWLEDRGAPVSMEQSPMHSMSDMKATNSMAHMNMSSMAMMPGMLTPQQMMALEQARGASFDHLFLTGMIQHHTGALVMVKDLFDTPGAGQDAVLFDFATDVDNTQRAEIDIMRSMLLKEKK